MELGKKLKKLRVERGLSQQKLADMIFVSRSAVAKWESGLGLPSKESREALAKVFQVPEEFFTMDEPEVVVVEKNRKIKRLSGSMCAVAMAALVFLIGYGLFHPVHYAASAACEKIEVQIMEENCRPFEITDEDTVDSFIDSLNEAVFQKSLRLCAGESAPDTMEVMLTLIKGEKSAGSVMLCPSAGGMWVYLIDSGRELVAVDGEALGTYIARLLEEETGGVWQLS